MHDVSHDRHKIGSRGLIVMYIGFVPDAGIGIAEVKKLKPRSFAGTVQQDRFSAAQTPHLPDFLSVQKKDDVQKR